MTDFISTELKALAIRFGDHDHEGLVMTGEELWKLAQHLRVIADAAFLLEREVVRRRRADEERQPRDRITAALAVPGTNVLHLFPKGNA
ncbi:hypothetical protein [Shinella sp. G-2]|uniref:hypothetical protein n=1 Tax=Shinella sp. G-2 TaxID=3133141 RepID=UPI003D0835DD